MCSTATSGRIKIERSKGRVYLVGDTYAAKDRIKAIGGHWDGDRRAWWVGAAKASEAESLVAKLDGQPAQQKTETASDIKVLGKARYKGRNYYVRWVGQCKGGDYKARLCSLDGKLDFWARAARPGEYADGDATMVKRYEEPRSLAGIARYIERAKQGEAKGRLPSDDCYYGPGGEPLMKGCGECRRLGRMCKQCEFDEYDM